MTQTFFLGLRGDKLNLAALFLVIMPAIVLFGYNQSLVGGLMDFPAFEERFPQISPIYATLQSDQDHRTTLRGTIVALYAVGGIIGAVSCIWLGDVRGRRITMFVSAIFLLVGAVLMTTSYSFAQFIVSRVVLGLGTGGLLATATVWQSEISNAKRRGNHVTLVGCFIGFGLCFSLWMDYAFYFTSSEISFRIPFIIQVIFSLMVIVFVYRFPESPRYLMKKGRVEEAREIMIIIEEGMLSIEEIDLTIRDQQTSIELAGKVEFLDFLKMGKNRNLNRTVLAVTSLIGLQLTGVNAITLYTSILFNTYLGLEPTVAKPLAALYQMTSILGGILSAFTVDRYGRRTLMMASSAGNAICMALLAALLSYPENRSASKAATFFLYFYHFLYVIGWGGIPFLYASEISPLAHRASINGLAVAGFWAFNFMIGEVTPIAYDHIGAKYLIVWAVANFALIFVIYFFFPETSRRSLEEVDEIFASSTGWLECVRVAKSLPEGNLYEMESHMGSSSERDLSGKPVLDHYENA